MGWTERRSPARPKAGSSRRCWPTSHCPCSTSTSPRNGKRSGPAWTRAKRRRQGVPTYRLVRYAGDFAVLVGGPREEAETLWDHVATVLAPMGLRLSEEKTRVCHIDEGFDFLVATRGRTVMSGFADRRVKHVG